jgi:hypothetical protein
MKDSHSQPLRYAKDGSGSSVVALITAERTL